ncbi:MAG TPA: aminotransferase class V-fold PLP-dependent enzyme [Solirubrobacteraceae bacterium]|nr:aminotransferase class V-fold PLP-dependent enzyme [Solirubrobacteraceae bacterium]
MEIADARRLFSPEGTYLNTATYGLPPRTAIEAMGPALDEWRHGRTQFEHWDESVGRARRAFAALAHVDPADVAVGGTVSAFAGLVAAALPDGARVLAVEGDFTSVLFPFLAQAPRGVEVELAPLERLAEALGPEHDLVAFSAVQSADGRIADVDAVVAAAAAHDVRTFTDTTQGTGWHDLDHGRFDYTACAGYKWLLAPRGTAYFTLRPEHRDSLLPHGAGWYAGDDVPASYYGAPLRLARDARRFDLSPAWHCWIGAAPAAELLAEVGAGAIGAHDVALADRLREGLGMEPGNSAIVSLDGLPADAAERLAAARIMAAGRGGLLRLSFHLYTTEEDVDRALAVLRSR